MNRLFTLAAVAILTASASTATTLTITGITGTWGSSQLANSLTPSGEGTNNIAWGDPATDAGSSGYRFDAETVPFVPASNPFKIGDFTHFNFPVYPPSLISTALTVTVEGNVDGNMFSTFSTYGFSHLETPNTAPCFAGSVSICDDIVLLTSAIATGDSIVVGDEEYLLKIVGFEGGLLFNTQENQTNTAALYGTFTTERLAPVPVPASALLLGSGIAGAGFWARRRKAKQKRS